MQLLEPSRIGLGKGRSANPSSAGPRQRSSASSSRRDDRAPLGRCRRCEQMLEPVGVELFGCDVQAVSALLGHEHLWRQDLAEAGHLGTERARPDRGAGGHPRARTRDDRPYRRLACDEQNGQQDALELAPDPQRSSMGGDRQRAEDAIPHPARRLRSFGGSSHRHAPLGSAIPASFATFHESRRRLTRIRHGTDRCRSYCRDGGQASRRRSQTEGQMKRLQSASSHTWRRPARRPRCRPNIHPPSAEKPDDRDGTDLGRRRHGGILWWSSPSSWRRCLQRRAASSTTA